MRFAGSEWLDSQYFRDPKCWHCRIALGLWRALSSPEPEPETGTWEI